MNFSPPKAILFFFLAIIVLGTALLSLPFSLAHGGHISVLANLFTSTSSVCVTGLSVVDIGTYYSFFGQLVILLLIQAGGLGYMVLSTALGLFFGKISLKERAIIKETMDVSSFAGLLGLLKRIIAIVFIIESAGAVILTLIFWKHFSFGKALYYGIFHSISAFCNAGLSPFKDNLESYANNYMVLITIAGLIILGGIGFLVLLELGKLARGKEVRLSLHSRIVLFMTFLLTFSGLAFFWGFENHNTLLNKGLGFGFVNSFFQSVTARTAGFDSLPMAMLTPLTALLLIILMFIGASPGGTGGGVKTSTFAVIMVFLSSVLQEKDDANVYGKRLSLEIIHKSIAIFILSLFVVSISALLLISTQQGSTLNLLFESVSAFGTVGLSRGITSSLNDIGQFIIIVTMITGRIGVLAFLVAFLGKSLEPSLIKYPEGKVLIG